MLRFRHPHRCFSLPPLRCWVLPLALLVANTAQSDAAAPANDTQQSLQQQGPQQSTRESSGETRDETIDALPATESPPPAASTQPGTAALTASLLGARALPGAALPGAGAAAMDGDRERVWLFKAVQTPKGTRGGLFVQRADNPDGRLMLTTVLPEPPPTAMTTGAMAAEQNRVWVLTRNGDVAAFRLVERPPGPAQIIEQAIPNLPKGVRPLSVARANEQTFLLCRVPSGLPIESLLDTATTPAAGNNPRNQANTQLTQQDMADLYGLPLDELPARFQILPQAPAPGSGKLLNGTDGRSDVADQDTNPSPSPGSGKLQTDANGRSDVADQDTNPAPAPGNGKLPPDADGRSDVADQDTNPAPAPGSGKLPPEANGRSGVAGEATTTAPAPAYDVLLVRDRLSWRVLPLPETWPDGDTLDQHHVLIISDPARPFPALLTTPRDGQTNAHLYTPAPGSGKLVNDAISRSDVADQDTTPAPGSGKPLNDADSRSDGLVDDDRTPAQSAVSSQPSATSPLRWDRTPLGPLAQNGQPPLHLDATVVDRQIILGVRHAKTPGADPDPAPAVRLYTLRPQSKRPLNPLAIATPGNNPESDAASAPASTPENAPASTPENAPANDADSAPESANPIVFANWGLIPRGQAVDVYTALASVDPASAESGPPLIRMVGQRVTLTGNTHPAPEITEYRRTPLDQSLDFIILVLVLAVSTLVVIFVWPREIKNNKLDLPTTLMLAMPGRRMMGAFIDLMPCFWIAQRIYDQSNDQILWFWPGMGHAQRVQDLFPALTVIGLYALHTTVTELFFNRSLGKLVFRTKLSDLKGRRPSSTSILIRGLIKPLDLIGLPLLTMALFHNRQRFGDLLGKVVVIQDKPQHLLEREKEAGQNIDTEA